jgi:hypothetical protein
MACLLTLISRAVECKRRGLPNLLRKRAGRPSHKGNIMKLVTAIIKPFKLEEVRSALTDLGCKA